MSDLVAFLAARLDEDEAAAKVCQSPSPWKAATHESNSWIVTDATGAPVIYNEGTPSLEEAAHIARHDPARVLREVAAKRAILEAHPVSVYPGHEDWGAWCKVCITDRRNPHREEWEFDVWPCPTVRGLAAVYSDHPDYQQEWKATT